MSLHDPTKDNTKWILICSQANCCKLERVGQDIVSEEISKK